MNGIVCSHIEIFLIGESRFKARFTFFRRREYDLLRQGLKCTITFYFGTEGLDFQPAIFTPTHGHPSFFFFGFGTHLFSLASAFSLSAGD